MAKTVLTFFVGLACLAAQDVSQQQAKLEHIRAVNLERSNALPSFVAHEVAVRYTSRHADPPQWQPLDTIESEIVVRGADFTRQNVRIDGKPWTKPNLPNFTWSVDFGSDLKPLFDPECKAVIAFEGAVEALGKPALAFRFRDPADGCFGTFSIKNGSLLSGKTTGLRGRDDSWWKIREERCLSCSKKRMSFLRASVWIRYKKRPVGITSRSETVSFCSR